LSERSAAALAARLGGTLVGPDREYSAVASLETAGPESVAFLGAGALSGECGAGVLLIKTAIEGRTCIEVEDPKLAFIQVIKEMFPEDHIPGIHAAATVDPTAEIDESATLHPGVVVGARCRIGARSVLHPGVVLYPDTEVGSDCVLHAGCVLGADGFSFHPTPEGPVKVPQVGRVVVADHVELGANCCVDRAFLGETVVGPGCKLDNLVHIGHNATLGRHVIIAAQGALSGSVNVGDGAILGGQVGVVEHIHIGARAQVGAQSGVGHDVPDGESVLGTPALPASQMRRVYAALKHLPEMFRRWRD